MEDFEKATWSSLWRRFARQRHLHKWLLISCIAVALMGILGAEALLGSPFGGGQVLAAGLSTSPRGAVVDQHPTWVPTMQPGTPGSQCGGQLTVTKVTGRTITVTKADGSTVTVHVNAHTHYTKNGTTASISAIKVGSQIYVVGTCGHNGAAISASTVEIVS
jgi:hypothetical protein